MPTPIPAPFSLPAPFPASASVPSASMAKSSWLEDPAVFAVNRLPCHSDHASDSPAQSLAGAWKFRTVLASEIDVENAEFAKADAQTANFRTIDVPSTLETEGGWRPAYVNIQMPWDGHEDPRAPKIPSLNHAALYRREFRLDPALAEAANGGNVTIVFEGFATAIYVWLDGAFVGYAEDGYTPSEFDVTGILFGREGADIDPSAADHVLTVACFEHSSASWLEDQDSWRFHGLFRDVVLTRKPRTHLDNLRVNADYDHLAGAGSLNIDAAVAEPQEQGNIRAVLTDDAGAVVWQSTARQQGRTRMSSGELPGIRPWSAEDPALYTLTLTLTRPGGAASDAEASSGEAVSDVVETVSQRVGFRRFAVEDGIMTLNGKRIVFKGVNRHEFDCHKGRALTEQQMIDDIVFCKRHNINAIRTSHYPNDRRFYALADRYGVYLIDEANLETHGSWNVPGDVATPETALPGSRMEWEGPCVDRVESMIHRDYNHPSVLVWSLGNESYGGEVFRSMYRRAHELDPVRPVHYEGITWNREYDDVTDIESRMYAHPDAIEDYVSHSPKKPYISCEYMHAMGNSVGGLFEYTDLEKYPHYQGGFIWDLIDQALWKECGDETLGELRGCLEYGGGFADRPCDYEFSGDGLLFGDRSISPKAAEVKQVYSNIRLFPSPAGVRVVNDNLFASTESCDFVASLLVDGVSVWSQTHRFDVPAGNAEDLPIPWPSAESQTPGAELTYDVGVRLAEETLWAPAGHEIAFGQHTVRVPAKPGETAKEARDAGEEAHGAAAAASTRQAPAVPSPCDENAPGAASADGAPSPAVTVGRWNVGLRGGPREALLSRTQGGIVSWTKRGREYVLRPPRITTFRPLTDNDRGAGHGFDRARWAAAGRYARCVDVAVDASREDGVAVTYVYELATPAKSRVTLRYAIDSDVRIRLTADYPGEAHAPTIPAFGVEWALPGELRHLRYYGLGPEETYADRSSGARLGVWETTAARDYAPYLVPQETGNHRGVRWAEITDGAGSGIRVRQHAVDGSAFAAADAEEATLNVSLLPYSSAQIEEASHQWELADPSSTPLTHLRLLAGQMGVGGDDSWGSPVHEKYHIAANEPLRLDVDLELI